VVLILLGKGAVSAAPQRPNKMQGLHSLLKKHFAKKNSLLKKR
jgi:hypothetical protein